jgi:hypothetical protein
MLAGMKALRGGVVLFALAGCSSSSPGPVQAGDAGDGPAMTSDAPRDTGVNCSCGRGAYVPMCGVDGKTYDAACGVVCVPVKVACEGQCPCAAGAPRPCDVNADCDAGKVCYVGASGSGCMAPSYGGFSGECVTRTTGKCYGGIGGGCACLDPAKDNCTGQSGGYCVGTDDPGDCWSCRLPL